MSNYMFYNKIKRYFLLVFALPFMQSIEAAHPKITVFIHGTLPPVINSILQKIDIPLGLTKATDYESAFFQGNVPIHLSNADPLDFPREHFYIFGWLGTMSRKVRLKAAEELYQGLKDLKGDITVIGHSHGGSVALNLAQAAANHKDSTFAVDRLILLGAPVQAATKHLVTSSTFKDVVSFYSPTDFLQICDMQGLYTEGCSFFSERNWPKEYNIPEIHVCFEKRDSWHLELIKERFLKHLPKALKNVSEYRKNHMTCEAKMTIHSEKKRKRSVRYA